MEHYIDLPIVRRGSWVPEGELVLQPPHGNCYLSQETIDWLKESGFPYRLNFVTFQFYIDTMSEPVIYRWAARVSFSELAHMLLFKLTWV